MNDRSTRSTAARRARAARILILGLCFGLALGASAGGCTRAYYSAMEQVGQHKRDILRSRIEAGQEEQQEAQEQIKTTYERFKEAADYEGGDFESVYKDLNDEYERSQARAAAVTDRIASIDRVASDLFAEWEEEIEIIGRANLQAQSRASLTATRQRYAALIGAMKRAESKMPPVLEAFRDQVLFMKHSLNARAIASLEGTVGEIENDVETLIEDIDASIRESERFLDAFDED